MKIPKKSPSPPYVTPRKLPLSTLHTSRSPPNKNQSSLLKPNYLSVFRHHPSKSLFCVYLLVANPLPLPIEQIPGTHYFYYMYTVTNDRHYRQQPPPDCKATPAHAELSNGGCCGTSADAYSWGWVIGLSGGWNCWIYM